MSVLERFIRAIVKVALGLSAASLLASLATIVYSVVCRYVFNAPVAWSDELVGYLLVASVMLAAAESLLGGEHISVDIVDAPAMNTSAIPVQRKKVRRSMRREPV